MGDLRKRIVRIAADHFREHGANRTMHTPQLNAVEIAEELGVETDAVHSICVRLDQEGLIEFKTLSRGQLLIFPEAAVVAEDHQNENPPEPPKTDHYAAAQTWWRTNPVIAWGVLALVALAAILTIIAKVKEIFFDK